MISRDAFEGLIGEGFHTAFRNAVDTARAATIHRLIADMPPEEWSKIVGFVADGMPPEMFQPDPEDPRIEQARDLADRSLTEAPFPATVNAHALLAVLDEDSQ